MSHRHTDSTGPIAAPLSHPGALMAITISGTKTVTHDVAPHLTASTLTTLLATAIENLTVAQLRMLIDAIDRVGQGRNPSATIGTLLK